MRGSPGALGPWAHKFGWPTLSESGSVTLTRERPLPRQGQGPLDAELSCGQARGWRGFPWCRGSSMHLTCQRAGRGCRPPRESPPERGHCRSKRSRGMSSRCSDSARLPQSLWVVYLDGTATSRPNRASGAMVSSIETLISAARLSPAVRSGKSSAKKLRRRAARLRMVSYQGVVPLVPGEGVAMQSVTSTECVGGSEMGAGSI